jgi:RHS repeat-associated protein
MRSPYAPQYYANATADEIRISNVARSADWITTEYHNQSSPTDFASVGGSPYFWVTTSTLPHCTQYISYSTTLQTGGGTSPYTWTVLSGALPPGFSLDPATGVISGLDQSTGTYTFTVQAVDGASNTAIRQFSIVVDAPQAIVISSTAPLTGAILNSGYNAGLSASGGVPPYTWSVASGILPAGLLLNASTGGISGTATTSGISTFTVRVQDARSNSTAKDFSIHVFSADSITPPAAAIGGKVTVSGTGFGATQGGAQVKFNTVTANVLSWSDSAVAVTVPSGAQTGFVTVTIDGATSSGIPFALEGAPRIASLLPTSGTEGAEVTITGTGFGATQSNSVVRFEGGVTASINSWSDTQIVATVPFGAIDGAVTVQVAGLKAYGPAFTVITLAQLTNSLGTVSSYTSQFFGGTRQATDSSGPGCSSCTVRGTKHNVVDANGNISSATDEMGNTTTYTYDSAGNTTSVTTLLNGQPVTTSYTYNSFGEVLTVTDALGNTTTNAYDSKGNLLTVTSPAPDGNTAASVTTFGYDSKGELTTITDPLNHVTTMAYNPVGLIQSITDGNNQTTTYEYDSHGNRTAVVDAMQHRTQFAYDTGDRLTTITYPDNTTTAFGYDYRGRRTSVTDQNGKTTTYVYDDADRLTSVTDAASHTTQYAYDTEDNLLSITDAKGRLTSFTYDAFGRVTQTAFPSSYAETYEYDAVGNLTSKTDRNGQAITYIYDALNRLSHKGYPDSTGVDYVYDLVGKLKQVTDPTGTYGFAYDNMGRLIGTTTQYSFLPGSNFTNSYTYDAASNRKTLAAPDSSMNTYAYDGLNRMTDLTSSWAGHFGFTYDNLSRRTQLAKPNGINTNYSYDSVSRLLSVLHQAGTTTVDGASYTNDNAVNRTAKQNLLSGISDNYSYDPIYQLTQVLQGTSTTEAYTYDDVGNRLSDVTSSGWQYNSSNQLTSTPSLTISYDQNGNTVTKADSNGTTQYNWDFENRLTSVTLPAGAGTVSFKYDPFGRRIEKVTASGTTIYTYDGANFIAEYNAAGALLAKYAQGAGIDEPLAISRSGQVGYYDADGLGSITWVIDNTLTPLATYTYDAFGKRVTTGGSLVNPFQYTGREWDQEASLYYYRARYYDPQIGRFISEDPIGFKAGINYYRYVRNNPANLTDPKGLYELKGFPAAEAAQMSIAIGQLAAKLRSNPCCIDPKLRDRVLDLLQPFKPGGVTFVYQQTLPASPGYITCAQVSAGWDFLSTTVTISQAALNGQCGCGLPGTILHEVVHLTWKNWFGSAPEGGAYGAGSACFGSNCGRPAGLTTP